MKKNKILVFGNILVEKDNLALKLIPKLKEEFSNIEFKEFDATENLEAEIENGKLMILDVAEGIENVEIIKNIKKLATNKIYGVHDFDLAYNLKLLEKIGKLKKVKIIAIPFNMDEEEAFDKVKDVLMHINS